MLSSAGVKALRSLSLCRSLVLPKRCVVTVPELSLNEKHKNQLEGAEPGDLVFYVKRHKPETDFPIIGDIDYDYNHISVVVDEHHVVESTGKKGVVLTPVPIPKLDRNLPVDHIEIGRIKASKETKLKAVEMARSFVGLPFNDLYAWDGINSKGERSLYCGQLVITIYKDTEVKFPPDYFEFHKGRPRDTEYWRSHFQKLGRKAPVKERATMPRSIITSPNVEIIRKVECELPLYP